MEPSTEFWGYQVGLTLAINICVCVCASVHVCVRSVYAYMCMCVCVCVWLGIQVCQEHMVVLPGTIHLSDGLETRALPIYFAHTSIYTIIVTGKNFREQGEAVEAVLTTEVMVDLTKKLASVWASAVDPSDSMMYCKQR